MATKLEEIAAKARKETKVQFTSLCHHVTRKRLWENLNHIAKQSAPGVDEVDVDKAKETFNQWIEPMLQALHNKGYKAPPVRRVWIPKPGKTEKRPIGVPCIADRALQRSVSEVLTAIYEQDFLPCSFGGRPKISAHHALATLNEVISGKKVGCVYQIGEDHNNYDRIIEGETYKNNQPVFLNYVRQSHYEPLAVPENKNAIDILNEIRATIEEKNNEREQSLQQGSCSNMSL